MNGRKAAKAYKDWAETLRGRRLHEGQAAGKELARRLKAAFREGAEAVESDWFSHEVNLVELRHVVLRHAEALEQTLRLQEEGRPESARARLEGAISELRRAVEKQFRDMKIEQRRAQLKRKREK
jgi:hypothetical protein